ncbi:hypothetical protein GOX01_05360 [Gluconobacter oxydans]|nr:hypothetical protein GOX01_05360 [Gluconobacter oxydans]
MGGKDGGNLRHRQGDGSRGLIDKAFRHGFEAALGSSGIEPDIGAQMGGPFYEMLVTQGADDILDFVQLRPALAPVVVRQALSNGCNQVCEAIALMEKP